MTDPAGTIRALIVDDEPPARRLLRRHLEEQSDVEVVGEATDGRDAVLRIRTLDPDVVFLDVQMPELDAFQVIAEVGVDAMPPVVFVTAYDAHAIQAFELNAVDYLLKPIEAGRVRVALDRIRDHRARDAGADLARLLAAVRGPELNGEGPARIPVRVGSRIRMVPQAEIDYVRGEGNYVRLHIGKESHQLRESLTAMEQRLASPPFVRVHRSTIVNVNRVVELEPLFKGEYVLRLATGQRITTGRSYRDQVRRAFGL